MRNFALPLLLSCAILPALGQFSTPGTGVHWTMDSLSLYSGGVVLLDVDGYLIIDDLIVSETDSVSILNAGTVIVSPSRIISVFGYIETGGDPGLLITSNSFTNLYGGIRIESGAEAIFRNTEFSYGGGIKCISGNVLFESCNISYQQNIATSGAAIDLFEGSPVIMGCTINNNQGSAISSPGNIQCTPTIIGCTIEGNNTENSNRPQINLGASGTGLAIIQDNIIIGNPEHDQAGGIAVASLFGVPSNVWIQGNTVRDNRYGIALFGNGIIGTIRDNIIIDNNTQGDPILGGSGINLNGSNSSSAVVAGNTISGNLWGVTVQNDFQLDMGNPDITADSEGDNTFSENGNGGVTYAIYNNTPSPIPAVNNCWIADVMSSETEVEEVIFHAPDDASLGLVDYSPFQCGIVSGLDEVEQEMVQIYPNPSSGNVSLSWIIDDRAILLELFTMDGRLLFSSTQRVNTIDMEGYPSGLYLLKASNSNESHVLRLIKE